MTSVTFEKFAKQFSFSLVLLAPFINFLRYNDYPYQQLEALLIILGLITLGWGIGRCYEILGLVGKLFLVAVTLTIALSFFPTWQVIGWILVTIFVVLLLVMLFLQHERELLTIIFGVFILGVLFLPMITTHAEPVEQTKPLKNLPKNLPPIIYIILDEHMGIESVPNKTLKQTLTNFYLSHGFRLFANAYSHYHETHNSIPNALNFTSLPKDDAYFTNPDKRQLGEARFFELLAKKGYQFKIYEVGDYLDYCERLPIPIASCFSVSSRSVGMLAHTQLSVTERLVFLIRSFLLQSSVFQLTAKIYQDGLRPWLSVYHVNLLSWAWYDAHVSSLSMLQEFAKLHSDILQETNGTVFFMHVFAPHGPYVYDASCRLLTTDQWRGGTMSMPISNKTAATRAEIYPHYDQQVLCTEQQVQNIFNVLQRVGVYDKAIIIIHGDHGSRIAVHEPYVENKIVFRQQDFQDYFPTLFAVKMPGYRAGYETSLLDLQSLLANVAYELTGVRVGLPHEAPYVYFSHEQTKGQALEKVQIAPYTARAH